MSIQVTLYNLMEIYMTTNIIIKDFFCVLLVNPFECCVDSDFLLSGGEIYEKSDKDQLWIMMEQLSEGKFLAGPRAG